MNNSQKKLLIKTPDWKLLKTFPGHTRQELRSLKNQYIEDFNYKPKILLIDIETFPNICYSWSGKFEVNIIDFIKSWYILCFAYKWLGGKTKVLGLDDFNTKSDKPLLKVIWKLFDEADIVIAQNGDRFDIKKINTRFLMHRMKPPSPYKTIDTLKVARRRFSFNSNKLDDLGRDLKIGRKVEHEGFPLWLRCAEGNRQAWKKMKKYNATDVQLLEKLYLKELPYIDNFPKIKKPDIIKSEH